MAGSIADMLIQGSSETAQSTGAGLESGIKTGAALAQNIQEMQFKRQAIEQKKQDLSLQKIKSVADTLKLANDSKDPKLRNLLLNQVAPNKAKALGVEQVYTPDFFEAVKQAPVLLAKANGLRLHLEDEVNNGRMTGGQAAQIYTSQLGDVEGLAASDFDKFSAAQKFSVSEEGKTQRAHELAQAQLGKQIQGQNAAPKVEAAKKINDEYVNYEAQGGKSGIDSKLKVLEEVRDKLASGKIKTGTITAAVFGDKGLAALDPDVKAALDDVRNSIQLKKALDSQFSAKEAEITFARAIDPVLPNRLNVKKLDNMISALKSERFNKEEQFRKYGLLQTEAPIKNKVMNDYSQLDRQTMDRHKANISQLTDPSDIEKYLKKYSKTYGVSIDEAKKQLGLK